MLGNTQATCRLRTSRSKARSGHVQRRAQRTLLNYAPTLLAM